MTKKHRWSCPRHFPAWGVPLALSVQQLCTFAAAKMAAEVTKSVSAVDSIYREEDLNTYAYVCVSVCVCVRAYIYIHICKYKYIYI